MSWHPAPEGYDARTPITVMVTPAQLMRIELYLAQVRETHPTADDNAITDLIFARGLDAAMEKPMESITPEQPPTVSKDDIAADRLYREGGGRFLQLGIGQKLADMLARTLKACREKSPHYAEDSLLRHALECGLGDIAAGIRDLQEYPQTGPDDARATAAETDTTPPGMVRHALHMPTELNPTTQDLVRNFAEALASKLNDAQQKHGWTDDWTRTEPATLNAEMVQHIKKGDPRDVAAFCAMLWAREAPCSVVGYVDGGLYKAAQLEVVEARAHARKNEFLAEERAAESAGLLKAVRRLEEAAHATAAQHRADMDQWRSDIERLTDQLEAARCRSIPDAIAVLQDAVADTGAQISITPQSKVTVLYGLKRNPLSITLDAADTPEVLQCISVLYQHHRPKPTSVTPEV